MARFVSVSNRSFLALMLAAFAVAGLGHAQSADADKKKNPAPTPPQANAPAQPGQPQVKTVQAQPQPQPDAFTRFGRILAPSDEVAYPMKLNLPFPGIGEMKIPTQEELNVRDKLEQLAQMSDDDIRAQLDQWPPFSKMKLGDEGQLLMRIQQFKEQRSKIAMNKAHDLGLLTLTPEQKAQFEKDYWDKRLKMEHDLVKQFEPVMHAQEQKMQEELFRTFSAPNPAGVPPAPAPPKQQPAPPLKTAAAATTNAAPVVTSMPVSNAPPQKK